MTFRQSLGTSVRERSGFVLTKPLGRAYSTNNQATQSIL